MSQPYVAVKNSSSKNDQLIELSITFSSWLDKKERRKQRYIILEAFNEHKIDVVKHHVADGQETSKRGKQFVRDYSVGSNEKGTVMHYYLRCPNGDRQGLEKKAQEIVRGRVAALEPK